MSLSFYQPQQLSRGIGFNRNTWEMGNRIGRAARPYLNNMSKYVKNYLTRGKEKRYSQKQKRRIRPITQFKGRQISTGGGDSESKFLLKKKATSLVVRVSKDLPVSTVVNNSAQRVVAPVGLQNWFVLGDYFSDDDCILSANLLYGNAAGAAQSAKTVLESCHSVGMITNQENVNARISLYDVICKKDTDATVSNPYDAVSTGYNDIGGGASTDFTILGVTPFSIPRFVEYFKILQTTEVVLSPGQCHVHKVHYAPNSLFSKTRAARIAGSGIGGLTMYTLVRVHGTPINDQTTESQVSTSAIALSVTQHEEYKLKAVYQGTANTDINNTLPSTFNVGGSVMADDGTVQAEQDA